MRGGPADVVGQSSKIDDAPHAGARGGTTKVGGSPPVQFRELRPGGHGMNEVVRRVHASEGADERGLVEAVTLDDLCRGPARRDFFRLPRDTSNSAAGLFEMSKQTAADVSSSAGEQNVGLHMTRLEAFRQDD